MEEFTCLKCLTGAVSGEGWVGRKAAWERVVGGVFAGARVQGPCETVAVAEKEDLSDDHARIWSGHRSMLAYKVLVSVDGNYVE